MCQGLRRGTQWHKHQLEGLEMLYLVWTGLTHTVLTGRLSPYALPSLVLFSSLEWEWGRDKH